MTSEAAPRCPRCRFVGAQQNVFVIALTNPTRDPLARTNVTPPAEDEAVLDFRGVLDRPKGNGHASSGRP